MGDYDPFEDTVKTKPVASELKAGTDTSVNQEALGGDTRKKKRSR